MDKTVSLRVTRPWRARVIVASLVAFAGTAQAQPSGAQAEMLFRQGKELMAAGKIAEACAAFDMSQKLDPAVTTLLNQANCRERNGQLATAWGLFLEAGRQTSAASDAVGRQLHAVAVDRAARLEPRLSTLRIDVPDASRIGGLEILRDGDVVAPAAWNKALPVDGGSYQISARAPGNAQWSTTVAVAAERDARAIEIPKLHPAELGRSEPEATPAPEPDEADAVPESGLRWTTRRKVAIGAAGGAVLVAATGAVLGATATSRQSDAHALCPDPRVPCGDAGRANALVRSGHDLAIGANVAFGIAGAAAIAAGVLWFTGAPDAPRDVVVAPAAAPGQLVFAVTRRF